VLVATVLVVASSNGRVYALPPAPEVPLLVYEDELADGSDSDDDLDLANLVTSAAKTVTTVQEAPAIITILTGEELRDRQQRTLVEIADLVPGFLRFDQFKDLFPQVITRGVPQGLLYLHDGFSMFDPMFNAPSLHRGTPLETIKRIEIISGPGGVLWGANSFLGVMNVISKDADDVNGVEAGISYADGKGDRQAKRGYVMAGIPGIFGNPDNGLVLHASFEDYVGQIRTRSQHMFSQPLPNPNSWFLYGPVVDSDPPSSMILDFDGKLTVGKLTIEWQLPYMKQYVGVAFNEPVPQQDLPDDALPQCSELEPNDPALHDPSNQCLDRGHAARFTLTGNYERYLLADYHTRFSAAAGLSAKAYFIQFVRGFEHLTVLPPVAGLLQGGLAFGFDVTTYRAGASIDGDAMLGDKLKVLYGVEAFHEWLPDDTTDSRQGEGRQATFFGPENYDLLPVLCPRTAMWSASGPVNASYVPGCPQTFAFKVSRSTIGAFTSAQLRPSARLILDGGVRLQAAPAVTSYSRSYGLTPTFSGAAVYEFVPDWHLKLNYAEGFRSPVYNNTDSNGEAVSIDGDENLKVETSRSGQAEVNARLFRGVREIRELDLRADYSYTVLDNYISFIAGRYANTARRGIHSAELLAKLYLRGGHRVELGYTFNKIDTDDKGTFGSMPNHWFSLSSVNPLVAGRLELATVLHVYGAFEDPNRRVEARGLTAGMDGVPSGVDNAETVHVYPTETVIDRAPPSAEIQVGLRLRALEDKLMIQATIYDAFANERFEYDPANDLEPRLDITPNAFASMRAFVSAAYTF
jgi:outer membrane receptor protein involved in Fe transport